MPTDALGRDIADLFDELAPELRLDELAPPATARPRAAFRWRPVLTGAVAVVAVGALAWSLRGDVVEEPVVALTDPGWEAVDVPEGIGVADELMVWTGSEIIFWGGQVDTIDNTAGGEPGMAYNPETRSWRTLAPSPKEATYWAAGVWTGEEVIFCCGSNAPDSVRTFSETVAYNPTTDSWRLLAEAPIPGPHSAAVWTGDEMLVVTAGGMAGYDPDSDRWRTFPEAPLGPGMKNEIVWTGDEAIVWSRDVVRAVYTGMALDPVTEEWRVLPDPPAWPAAPDLVWTGENAVIWGGLPANQGSERAVGSVYDPSRNEWTPMSEPLPEPEGFEGNLGSQTLLWTGDVLLVSTGSFGSGVDAVNSLLLAYNPTEDAWEYAGRAPAAHWGGGPLMAGDRVVFRSDRLYLSKPGWVPQGDPVTPDSWPSVTTTTSAPSTTVPPGPEVSTIPLEERIPLRILAIRPNNPSFAMLDFETGTTSIYPPGVHRSTQNATDAAVFTAAGDLVVNSSGTAYLFTDTLDQEPVEITPDPLRVIPGIASEIRVVPTGDGARMWMIQPGIGYGDNQYPTLIDLVEIPSGRSLLQAEVEPNASPVAVTGTGLILADEALMDTGEGWATLPGSQRVLHLLEDGSSVDVGPGTPIAATDESIIRLVCGADGLSCDLVFTDLDGSNSRTVAQPLSGTWSHLGGPGIPSVSMPLEAVSPDVSKLLMGIGSGFDVNSTPAHWALVIIDLESLTTRVVAESDDDYPLATWSPDGEWIVVLRQDDVRLINVADPDRVISLEDVIPAEHFPLAAG